jgi:N-hydroxyarylamine O-acetyltransferase
MDVDRYLERINFTAEPRLDLETLASLQLAHLTAVPFENLHVYHGVGVRTDTEWSVTKIVDERRGGWCFEANGAFADLLEVLGFDVARLGAAVLLAGPNETVDHLTLEVALDEPYLVDVGFGASFIVPLALNRSGPQDGGSGVFELIPSEQGLTLTEHADGVPAPLYRFKRVRHQMADFDAASDYLQSDTELHWSQKPFATRLIDHGPDRVTLLSDRLKIIHGDEITETAVAAEEWETTLQEWFGMGLPGA